MDAKIITAVIALIGVLSVPILTHFLKEPAATPTPPSTSNHNEVIKQLEIDLNLEKSKSAEKVIELNKIEQRLDTQIKINEKLKTSFHKINNAKLKQLLSFHNDAVCYGPSLNFTHPSTEDFKDCISKDKLAKTFLQFMAELGIIENNGGIDYSPQKAKNELAKWQIESYQFEEKKAGWYNNIMLGYLIIEYAKKS